MMPIIERRDDATARVAVIDPLPLFREGVAAVLSAAGHHVETPADPIGWAAQRPSALVLLTMAGTPQWLLLAGLREAPVIALIEGGSAPDGARAVRAGARSVLPRGVAQGVLRRTVEATMDGQAVLPAAVVDLLAAGRDQDPETVDSDRIGWLGKLASGTTVAQLAAQAGYSERAMFRLLAALYREMGARNRIEAVVRARDRGWI
jgi:DNA-binding NarL/FixJ family response regulator